MKIKTFYTYFRSSTAYRIRIALNLKGITPQETIAVNLREGQQHSEEYRKINPSRAVPVLVLEDGTVLTQSLAMLEWLEEAYPKIPLLPKNPLERAKVRAFAQAISCDIHPINNQRVLHYLMGQLGVDEPTRKLWIHHWIHLAFTTLEQQVAALNSPFCFGDKPTLADICLVPQWYNAERYGVNLAEYPTLQRITAHCLTLPAFDAARPEVQPDCDL